MNRLKDADIWKSAAEVSQYLSSAKKGIEMVSLHAFLFLAGETFSLPKSGTAPTSRFIRAADPRHWFGTRLPEQDK